MRKLIVIVLIAFAFIMIVSAGGSFAAKGGKKGASDQAYEHAVEILNNHQPPALPSGAAEAMSKIVSEFEKEIEKGGK